MLDYLIRGGSIVNHYEVRKFSYKSPLTILRTHWKTQLSTGSFCYFYWIFRTCCFTINLENVSKTLFYVDKYFQNIQIDTKTIVICGMKSQHYSFDLTYFGIKTLTSMAVDEYLNNL